MKGGRPAAGIDRFYTDLHAAMYDLADIDDAPFPTAKEFRGYLADQYSGGMHGLSCLDAGCGGTAVNTRSLAVARAGHVVAVDLNQRSLRLARASLARSTGAQPSIACGSLLDLPARTAAFDFIVCSGVVHHTPDPERAVRELRRVLKPQGRLYVSAYCFEEGLMFWMVRLWRLVARVVPFSLMHALFKRSATINNFVLDHMYVP